ncbi:MarR family transcriptional regulator [Natronomonas gomsonensis]|uniref:MarR family transcriptional regulator n=1 Tax=Natronomonas gomsonensis TaxID=1046043 RepID=UPI00227AE56B|nr:MarR family transcriptional regulator [Natronomonas gomsonensis]MCY4732167.1 MarR family transcriptional regulator [Natronomonas gomsonensis]
MPIGADRFEAIDDDAGRPKPETNAATILDFLEANANEAFTQTEIAEATEVTRGSVGPTLVRLRERGRVDHRGQYWRISDHDRSIDAATVHASGVAERHEESPFEYDEWQTYAVDPREQRE